MENEGALWEDWEGIAEEEVDFCFEGLESWDGVRCDDCEATFPSVKELKKHSRRHAMPASTPRLTEQRAREVLADACAAARKVNRDAPLPQNLNFDRYKALLQELNDRYTTGSIDQLYQHYSNICQNASALLRLPQSQAAILLTKIFDALVRSKEEENKAYVRGVDPRESDVLEYIGGRLLQQMSRRSNNNIAQCLAADVPSGRLIQIMEKKQNGLIYPSDDFKGILVRFYILHNKETAKPTKAIAFSNILQQIEKDPFYEKLVHKIMLTSGERRST